MPIRMQEARVRNFGEIEFRLMFQGELVKVHSRIVPKPKHNYASVTSVESL